MKSHLKTIKIIVIGIVIMMLVAVFWKYCVIEFMQWSDKHITRGFLGFCVMFILIYWWVHQIVNSK